MIPIGWALTLASLLAVPLVWCVPSRWAQDGVAAFTLVVLAIVSPASALWLLAVAAGTPVAMTLGDRLAQRGLIAFIWGIGLLAALVASRFLVGPLWIGGAYFTLRALHVLLDWWTGRLGNPGLRRHMRYQLYLPTLMAGPINRLSVFERQLERRRWDLATFLSGAERALFGTVAVVVLGSWGMSVAHQGVDPLVAPWRGFWRDWALSALDWVQLYFTFFGLTSLALGLSLMMGLRLEENFNQPWRARNLLDFWTRWHITLSQWARDYVFASVTALSRHPVLGLLAAMVFIGLWHEFSLYYVLWGLWQALGIVLTRLWQAWRPKSAEDDGLHVLGVIAGRVGVLAWLSLARPVLGGIDL